MTGYHIYYQTGEEGEFEQINHLVLLSSIINWKKNYGPIKLYCNKKYLECISKYGIDKEYDFIDTDFLETVPYKDLMSRYWSFCKIYLAKHLSEIETSFCILDTDLWIQKPGLLDLDKDVLFYHREAYDLDFKNNPYPEAFNWVTELDLEKYDWNTSPCNCAILCFNKNFKELIDNWYTMTLEIIDRTKENEPLPNPNADTIFIEQRLLPTLAAFMKVNYGLVLTNIYLTFTKFEDADGREWAPKLGHDAWSQCVVENIKHIWGAKRHYDMDWIRDLVITVTLNSIPGSYQRLYPELYLDCHKVKQK